MDKTGSEGNGSKNKKDYYGGLHPRSNVEWLYLPRNEEGRGLVTIEDYMVLEVMNNLSSLQRQN